MKIYTKQDFLKLSEGTFFAKGVKWSIDGFCVKGETWGDDFTYHNLVDFEWVSSEDYADSCDMMLETGKSIGIKKNYGRDGCFCDEDIFLVFEKEDLLYIKNLIEQNIAK